MRYNPVEMSTTEKHADQFEKGDAASTLNGDREIAELGISEPVTALQRFCNRLDALCGVEARGIERIPEELRARVMTYRDYIHMFTM